MKHFLILSCSLILLAIASCSKTLSTIEDGNGIYYWRTTLSLNDKEREFIDTHKVSRMYVRFFDVDWSLSDRNGEETVPNATIVFNDSLPEGVEIIPTVYLTTQAINKMQLKENEYAEKILRRINAMCKKNGIDYNEIQLDCDWTKGTRNTFFNLCRAFKANMDSTRTLSSTVRLHQLVQTPPPVDRGVLMVYNTGNLMDMTTENSIFSVKDIEPYLRDDRLAKYDLPLDVAYPTYGWSVIYHPGDERYYFYKLMKMTDFSDFSGIRKIGDNLYEATEDINFEPDEKPWNDIYKGYRIRVERPSAREILKVKELIESQLNHKPHSNILYHLDESQFSHYSDHEIDKIYHSN